MNPRMPSLLRGSVCRSPTQPSDTGALATTAISPAAQRTAPPGKPLASAGHTALEPGAVERWMAALPDPQARNKLQACAVELAAGMVAETEAGDTRDDEGYRNDLAW